MNITSQRTIVGPLGGLSGLGAKPEGSYVPYLLGLFDASRITGVEDGARLGSWLSHGTVDLALELSSSDRGGWQRYRGGARPSVEFDGQSYTADGDDYGRENLLLQNGETNVFFRFRATDEEAELELKQGPLSYKRRTFTVRQDRLETHVRGYQSGPTSNVRTPNNFDGKWHTVRFHVSEEGAVTFYRDGERLATDEQHGSSWMVAGERGNNTLTAKNMQIAMIATAGTLTEGQISEVVQRDQVGAADASGWWPWLALLGVGAGAYLLGRSGSDQTTTLQVPAKKSGAKKSGAKKGKSAKKPTSAKKKNAKR